jgi:CheY-like chemotaxis protein
MPSASAIIAMTANAFPEDIQKAKEAGMNGHLAKPIDPRQIVSLLSAYFAK